MDRNDKRLAYQGKVEAQLKEWGSQIDGWQGKTQTDGQRFIADLNSKRQVVRAKLYKMKDAADDGWHILRTELDQAVESMKQAVETTREKFR